MVSLPQSAISIAISPWIRMDPNGRLENAQKTPLDFPRLSLHRGVMMHCLKHLPADDFASELPRILGASVDVYSSWKPSFAHMIRMGSPKNDGFPLGWRTSQFLFFGGDLWGQHSLSVASRSGIGQLVYN